jgi:hypothetical protein
MFTLLVAFSALFIAACAAFFSIKGLILLFAGSALSVGIMASALELGKLVAASFLHRNWKTTGVLLKSYLCIAVIVLMGITSLGIFGFLTNAYQGHATTVKGYEVELAGIESQKKLIQEEIQTNQERIQTLFSLRKDQEERVKSAGNYKAPREQAYKAIEETNQEVTQKEARQIELREKLKQLEISVSTVQKDIHTKTDIGSFKFIAEALNCSVDEAVRIFIFCLVFVFDPLAVTLVLALNQLIEVKQSKKKKDLENEEVLNTPQVTSSVSEPVVSAAVTEENGKASTSKRKKQFNPENNTIIIK